MKENQSPIPLRRRKGMLFGGGQDQRLLSPLLALAFLLAACAPSPASGPLADDAGRTISLAPGLSTPSFYGPKTFEPYG